MGRSSKKRLNQRERNLAAVHNLEANWREHGPGITEHQQRHTVWSDPEKLHSAPDVFQPRLRLHSAPEIEKNIADLARILASNPAQGRSSEWAIWVFAIAGDLVVVDGHCRLDAYKRAGRDRCPIRILPLSTSFAEALRFTAKRNAVVKLSLAASERKEAAWRLVQFRHTQPEDQRASIRTLALETGLGPDLVFRMSKALTTGIPARGVPPEELMTYTWARVLAVKRYGKEEADHIVTDQARRARLTRTLRSNTGRHVSQNPEDLWPASIDAYGQTVASRAFNCAFGETLEEEEEF